MRVGGNLTGQAEWGSAALCELPTAPVLKVKVTFILLTSNPKGGQNVPALLLAVPCWDALTKVRGKMELQGSHW